MKTIKIPECMNPFEVTINGKHYSYPAGTEWYVPDEVAAVIEAHENNHKANQVVSSRPAVQPVTHYAVPKEEPMFEYRANLTVSDGDGVATTDIDTGIVKLNDVSAGETVRVVFDGVEYFCEVVEFYSYGKGCGNLSLIQRANDKPECCGSANNEWYKNTGEPFCIVHSNYYIPRSHLYATKEGEHSFDVCKAIEVVHKIHTKYLPEGYGWVEHKEMKARCFGMEDTPLDGFPAFESYSEVTAKVDGVEYTLTAKWHNDGLYIGDSFEQVDNGTGVYGWQICCTESGVYFVSREEHVVSWDAEVVHKFDKNLLPSDAMIMTTPSIMVSNGRILFTELFYDDGTKATNTTGQRLIDFLNAGGRCLLFCNGVRKGEIMACSIDENSDGWGLAVLGCSAGNNYNEGFGYFNSFLR